VIYGGGAFRIRKMKKARQNKKEACQNMTPGRVSLQFELQQSVPPAETSLDTLKSRPYFAESKSLKK
jgi:hypothetical protein